MKISSRDYLPEAWRIKMVERLRPSTKNDREAWIRGCDYNLFGLRSDQVFIDLLTDSGTGAMSDRQWATVMEGDESYAGSASFARLQGKVKELFGFNYFLPVHQGRAAENALFSVLLKEGDIVPGNSHFDTTRAHIESRKAVALDCPIDVAFRIDCHHLFKGNLNLEKLRLTLEDNTDNIPFILITITCNKSGGQPVSLENIRQVKKLADLYQKPLIFDSARFAENAWFIQQREPGYSSKNIPDIVREMYQYADAMLMSGKKDGLVNIGGFLATQHKSWFDDASSTVILFEGFKTYGGLAGRDLEALATGLDEVVHSDYLRCRIGQVEWFGNILVGAGIPVQQPIGGHAVFIDAAAFLPLVPREEFVAQTLAIELYIEAGVRGVEIGTLLNDRDPATGRNRYAKTEFVRLAIPRRVFTNDHLGFVAQALIRLYHRRLTVTKGLYIIEESKTLRHFTVRLARKGTNDKDVVEGEVNGRVQVPN